MLPSEIREKVVNPTFRVISKGACIKPTLGTITISSATGVFTGRIDPAFAKESFCVAEGSKGETQVEFLKMLRPEKFSNILNEYREGQVDSLVFTQSQIVSAVMSAKSGELFSTNDFFFLVWNLDHFSVVHVYPDIGNADCLSVGLLDIYNFVNLNGGACQYLFVVPKL